MSAGQDVLLAGSETLQSGTRVIGLFLVVFGALFGGVPLFLAFGSGHEMRTGQGMLIPMALLGEAAFFGGIYLLLLRATVSFDAVRRMVEYRRGFLVLDNRSNTLLSALRRVCLQARRVGKSGELRVVSLDGPAGISIPLGDRYGSRADALDVALRAARATGLPVEEVDASGATRRLNAPPATSAARTMDLAGPSPWWQRPSAIALILANLVPLGGVLFAGWQVLPVLLLFWLENVVIGGYTLARMLLARGIDETSQAPASLAGKLFICAFFVVHYGAFTGGHGLFLTLMFGPDNAGGMGDFNPFNPVALIAFVTRVVVQHGLFLALLALVISHGVSFVVYYLTPRAYEEAVASRLMVQPYGRVVVLHIVILVGGFAAKSSGEPVMALVLLVVLKIVIDLAAHLHEHRRKGVPEVEALAWVSVPAPAPAAAAVPSSAPFTAPSATAARLAARQDLNDQPLTHYFGTWEPVPGQVTPGWFGRVALRNDNNKLRLRLIDVATAANPVTLESITLRGGAERVEYIEARLRSNGRRHILRLTASGTDPNGLDLSEFQHPEGNPKAMQARSFALRRATG